MFFSRKKATLLSDFLEEPPIPWKRGIVASAAGVIASGWTKENKVFLYSGSGYSVTNVITGEREIRNYDVDDSARNNFSDDNLEFFIPELNETIKVFGILGGDGNHISSDSWGLDSFYPALSEQYIGISNFKERHTKQPYWKNFHLLYLQRLEYVTLKYGFSPNEQHFGIFGSAGAEIFTRVSL